MASRRVEREREREREREGGEREREHHSFVALYIPHARFHTSIYKSTSPSTWVHHNGSRIRIDSRKQKRPFDVSHWVVNLDGIVVLVSPVQLLIDPVPRDVFCLSIRENTVSMCVCVSAGGENTLTKAWHY